jgi:succinate dehydrogenase/fumarate reductase flavoprotein subunit
MSYGFDIRKQPIEVRPRPHYLCGGVIINTSAESTVPGLFAAGAVTAGVHGANRLGSNALTDILVFGDIAGRNAAARAQVSPSAALVNEEATKYLGGVNKFFQETGKSVTVPGLRRKHCEMMDAHMGVLRTREGLKTMLKEIDRAKREDLPNIIVKDKSLLYNYELRDAFEVPFRLALEEMSTRAALMREESRGSHFREDYPRRNDREWLKNIVFLKQNNELALEIREVDQSTVRINDIPEYGGSDSPWH